MKIQKLSVIVTAMLMMPGCASLLEYRPYARAVKQQPGVGGVIALNVDHREEDQNLARGMMDKNCLDKKVKVLEEGEVAIGTVTSSNSEFRKEKKEKVGSVFGMPIMSGNEDQVNSSSETVQKKEWQIQYKCS